MDYINMTPEQLSDLEREAYVAGDTDRADLLIALIEVMGERDAKEKDRASLAAQLDKIDK